MHEQESAVDSVVGVLDSKVSHPHHKVTFYGAMWPLSFVQHPKLYLRPGEMRGEGYVPISHDTQNVERVVHVMCRTWRPDTRYHIMCAPK